MTAAPPLELTTLPGISAFRRGHFRSLRFLGRRRPKDRVKYILWSLFLFLLVGIGVGWAMFPFSR